MEGLPTYFTIKPKRWVNISMPSTHVGRKPLTLPPVGHSSPVVFFQGPGKTRRSLVTWTPPCVCLLFLPHQPLRQLEVGKMSPGSAVGETYENPIRNLYLGSSLIESMFTLTLLFGWSADLGFQGYFVLKGMCLFLAIWYS